MKILAIETSCDDTGVSILESEGLKKPIFKVLSNVVSSQKIHEQYGGVFPMMAKREHQKNLVPVMVKSLGDAGILKKKKAIKEVSNTTLEGIFQREPELYKLTKDFFKNYEKPAVDLIAVTNGPGLEPCLWVGVNFAKALAYFWNIPIVPVNHIEAHILVNFLDAKRYMLNPKKLFPAISLVVSGGHTQLILVKGIGKYEIIGETRDDAAGECFDKCAKLLGLGYPGGPAIARIAEQWKKQDTINNNQTKLPRPMINSKDYDLSFSGLKTAVLYETKGKKLTKEYVGQMCVEIQQAIIDVLIKKTLQAAKDYKVKTIILGGGVSANEELRKQFSKKADIPVIFPEPKLSTDNGLMIAVAAYLHRTKKIAWQKLSANANLRVGK